MSDDKPMQNIAVFNEVFARLTMLEFFLEVQFAREWANFSDVEMENASAAMLDKFNDIFPAPNDKPIEDDIARRASNVAENLVYKISLRAKQIRQSS